MGISTASLAQVETAIALADIVCVQNAFSLVDRSDDTVLQRCLAEGIAYVPYFPLGSAFPGLPKVAEQLPVKQIAERHGATPAQVGLAWLLAYADNVLLIPGTSSLAHLEENLAVASLELSDDDMLILEQL